MLDALIAIREYQDQSLAVRCACRSAICGSCAMWINGHAHLACKSKLQSSPRTARRASSRRRRCRSFAISVCDMTPFWEKHLAVKPWLQNKQPIPPPNEEYRVPNACDGGADSRSELHQLRRLPDGLRVVCRQPGLPRAASARAGLSLRGRSARRGDEGAARRVQQGRRHLGLHALLRVRHAVPEGRRAARPDPQAAQDGGRRRLHEQPRHAPRRCLRRIGARQRTAQRAHADAEVDRLLQRRRAAQDAAERVQHACAPASCRR